MTDDPQHVADQDELENPEWHKKLFAIGRRAFRHAIEENRRLGLSAEAAEEAAEKDDSLALRDKTREDSGTE